MKLTVTERGLYLISGEARVGQVIEIESETVPNLYQGKVRATDIQGEKNMSEDERKELEELRAFKAQSESSQLEVATPEEDVEVDKPKRGRPKKEE